jgi:hypothetical protein
VDPARAKSRRSAETAAAPAPKAGSAPVASNGDTVWNEF